MKRPLRVRRATAIDHCARTQHLLPGSEAASVAVAAHSLIGLHSARLQSPFWSAQARVRDFAPNHLRDALYVDRDLIKLRCMRGTLHIVPMSLAPMVHLATVKYRLSLCRYLLKRLGVTIAQLAQTRDRIVDCVAEEPQSVEGIHNALTGSRINVEILRLIVKQLWEDGTLCYVNISDCWEREARRYGLTSLVYPHLRLCGDEETAVRQLVRAHINAFGPVSVEDTAWWCGLPPTRVRQVLGSIARELVEVHVEDIRSAMLMTEQQAEAMSLTTSESRAWIKVLAHEDPSLKAYYGTRERYGPPGVLRKLFNAIGEARASVVLSGEVVANWTWDTKIREARLTFLTNVGKSHREAIRRECRRVSGQFQEPTFDSRRA
jgi:hypothetical protein